MKQLTETAYITDDDKYAVFNPIDEDDVPLSHWAVINKASNVLFTGTKRECFDFVEKIN